MTNGPKLFVAVVALSPRCGSCAWRRAACRRWRRRRSWCASALQPRRLRAREALYHSAAVTIAFMRRTHPVQTLDGLRARQHPLHDSTSACFLLALVLGTWRVLLPGGSMFSSRSAVASPRARGEDGDGRLVVSGWFRLSQELVVSDRWGRWVRASLPESRDSSSLPCV